ncbi:MAG: glycosyltransferase family 2 protein [Acidimicrobiia bacterium]
MFLTNGPRVFVVLVNYRNPGDTLRCLATLRCGSDRDVHPVVVDNASGNGDAVRLRSALGPAVPVLETPANLGYAGGNNVGIRYALERDGDFVWLLNPDTEVEPETLTGLMTTMSLRPDAGFVGSLNLFGGSDPPTIQFAGGHIDWAGGVVAESIGRGKPLSSRPQRDPYEVDYVAGTSMLVRRRVFEDVGLLPEHYFLYFEETDFQVTAARHGWKSVINPLARVWHYQGSAAHLPAPYYTYYYIRGRLLFAKKFTEFDDETIVAGLDGFIEGWRTRVGERAPGWLDTYNRLVDRALADGKAGVTGPRADVDEMRRPGE